MTGEEVVRLKGWIAARPDWSRKRLAKELCQLWNWRDERGRIKDFAARSLLLKLEARGLITLPVLRPQMRRTRRQPSPPPDFVEPGLIVERLDELQPLEVMCVEAGTPTGERFAYLVNRYHYLGYHVVGENLGYVIRDRHQRELAALLWGAAAWKCAPRDQRLGWTATERPAGLSRIANNTRYVIFPWVHVRHLASHILGRVSRRIGSDWQRKYAHGLDWLETFVEMERFAGTCYRAAGWQRVGQTTGRSRQDQRRQLQVPCKSVWLLPLSR